MLSIPLLHKAIDLFSASGYLFASKRKGGHRLMIVSAVLAHHYDELSRIIILLDKNI